MTMDPQVDVIIAAHDPRREIDRAVRSVLEGTLASVRVTVVAHNVNPGVIGARLGDLAEHVAVRILSVRDDIPSPAGPFNTGLAAATAQFTSLLGSDDTLERGAIDAWLALAARDRADVVIAPVRTSAGRNVPTPPTRPGRARRLDGVRDRLSYRSAPLGLVSRHRFGNLRLTSGLRTGEDVAYVLQLWFAYPQASVSFARRQPAYVVHDDAPQRASLNDGGVDTDLAFVDVLLRDPWFVALPERPRQAIAVKLMRVNVFGSIARRPDPSQWTVADRTHLNTHTRRILGSAPRSERLFSIRERALIDVALDPSAPSARLVEAAARRRRFIHPAALLPRSPRRWLAREAPLRVAGASLALDFGRCGDPIRR